MESLIKKGIIAEIKDLQKPKRETFKEKLTQKICYSKIFFVPLHKNM